ncbi:hypothetical protein [Bosea rubneri]|uniref:Uncharacterized protein n=1 Tax=Bosea rubneri TaxID=3075434 RepID=A0ABU3S1B6_9HYPH|nr:hypothetical protein [Bosea sp. ZW T0_25]MDU0338554.1 hypothetical protein [Bosea sp. ZW T0_25]
MEATGAPPAMKQTIDLVASVDCFPVALDLIASGRIGYPKIASFFALEEAQTVFETQAENPTAYHKAVFRI